MLIRAMTAADLSDVIEIDQISFTTPWPPGAFEVELANPGARCWVVEDEDNVIGFLVFWRVLDEAELATLAIHPTARRRGLAHLLMQNAIDAAYKEGAHIYHLELRASNEVAQKLYESFGFEVVGRRRRYYKDNGEDAILMTKKVN